MLLSLINLVKRKVLSFFLNNKTVLDWRVSKGILFQSFGAQTEKALSPYVLVLQVGWLSRSWTFERRDLVDFRCSRRFVRYCKQRPFNENVVTKTRNHPKPPTKPAKTTYKTNQNDPKPATIYPNTTGLRDICVDRRLWCCVSITFTIFMHGIFSPLSCSSH